mgnify:CR=1 FL=1
MNAHSHCATCPAAAPAIVLAPLAQAADRRLAALLRAGAEWLVRLRLPAAGRAPTELPEYLLDDVDASGGLRARSMRAALERRIDGARLGRGRIDAIW